MDEEKSAFRQFINILVQFYPETSDIYELILNLNAVINTSEDIDLATVTALVTDQDNTGDWVGCRGSGDQYGGYTCGLWSLWHYLTVAQLETRTGDPGQVLRSMVSYVRHFFNCRECARHFLDMVGNKTDGDSVVVAREDVYVTSYEAPVLYLWQKHNDVTIR